MTKNAYQFGIYQLMFLIILFVFVSCTKAQDEKEEEPLPYTEGTVRLAKWQGNKKAAVNLLFDDSTVGQATMGVPTLNERNLVATWFVNPNGEYYLQNKSIWENDVHQNGQELANHTMNHTGAGSQSEAEYEVGEAARIIWDIRGDAHYGSLMAFNQGGGTTWEGVDLESILETYKNINRVTVNIGVPVKAKTILPGSKANAMLEPISQYKNDSNIVRVHFHGIAAEEGAKDYGNGAVWINDFKAFADELVNLKSELWISGFIQTYKYIQELKTATVKLEQYPDKYKVELTCDKDEKFFDEPLTVLVYLSNEWEEFNVTQGSETIETEWKNGELKFNALPNMGDIVIEKK